MRARTLPFLLVLLPLSGCFGAIADLDSYHVAGGGDFCWSMTGFTPHALNPPTVMPQAVGIRIIDDTNAVAAIVVYDPLLTPNFNGMLTGPLVAGTPYHVQIFADRNMSRAIDAYPADHTWDLPYDAPFLTMGCFDFPHGNPFNMVDTVASRPDDPMRGNAIINVGSRLSMESRLLVMTLNDVDGGSQVGLYRYAVRALVDPLPLPDLMIGDRTYRLDAFVDLNVNGTRDGDEPGYTDLQISGADGTDVTFSLDLMHPTP